MAKQSWRTKIDKIIAEEVEKSPLQIMRDNLLFFPISDQTMGFVSIYNQSSSKRALINVRLYILDFRLNYIFSQFYKDCRNLFASEFYFSLNTTSYRLPFMTVEQLELRDCDSEEVWRYSLSKLFASLKVATVAASQDFPSSKSISNFMRKPDQWQWPEYFVTLVLSGHVREAMEDLIMKVREMEIRESQVFEWKDFKSRFDKWLIDGADIPNAAYARQFFLESLGRKDLI